jgi:hypothetical protein
LGVREGAAKIRLHRARTRLKQELEAGCSLGTAARPHPNRTTAIRAPRGASRRHPA